MLHFFFFPNELPLKVWKEDLILFNLIYGDL